MNPTNPKYTEKLHTSSVFCPSKKQRKVIFDFDYLSSEYH